MGCNARKTIIIIIIIILSRLRLQGILFLFSDKLCRESGLLRRTLWRRLRSFRRLEKSYSLNVHTKLFGLLDLDHEVTAVLRNVEMNYSPNDSATSQKNRISSNISVEKKKSNIATGETVSWTDRLQATYTTFQFITPMQLAIRSYILYTVE
jgi:hypothetical protein